MGETGPARPRLEPAALALDMGQQRRRELRPQALAAHTLDQASVQIPPQPLQAEIDRFGDREPGIEESGPLEGDPVNRRQEPAEGTAQRDQVLIPQPGRHRLQS
jgi:hypothetical protein